MIWQRRREQAVIAQQLPGFAQAGLDRAQRGPAALQPHRAAALAHGGARRAGRRGTGGRAGRASGSWGPARGPCRRGPLARGSRNGAPASAVNGRPRGGRARPRPSAAPSWPGRRRRTGRGQPGARQHGTATAPPRRPSPPPRLVGPRSPVPARTGSQWVAPDAAGGPAGAGPPDRRGRDPGCHRGSCARGRRGRRRSGRRGAGRRVARATSVVAASGVSRESLRPGRRAAARRAAAAARRGRARGPTSCCSPCPTTCCPAWSAGLAAPARCRPARSSCTPRARTGVGVLGPRRRARRAAARPAPGDDVHRPRRGRRPAARAPASASPRRPTRRLAGRRGAGRRDGRPSRVRSPRRSRPLYHAALAHGANHLVTLVRRVRRPARRRGVEHPADRCSRRCCRAALDNALRHGDRALTGPVVARRRRHRRHATSQVLRPRARRPPTGYSPVRTRRDRARGRRAARPSARRGRCSDVLAGKPMTAHRERVRRGRAHRAREPARASRRSRGPARRRPSRRARADDGRAARGPPRADAPRAPVPGARRHRRRRSS